MTTDETMPRVDPERSGEQTLRLLPAIVRRDLRVTRVEDLTPRYRRIVLGGDVLAEGFPFERFACHDHVKVYFPDPDSGRLAAYRETADGGWEVDVPGGTPLRRDYTPRAFDQEARELTVEFVIHDHGVAGAWARDAGPGDEVVVMGPRANWLLPEDYGHYLAIGDETALPAISRLVEEAPGGALVTAVVEVADQGEELPLSPGPGVRLDLRWVHRDTASPSAGHRSALESAVRQVPLPDDLDDLFVFAAGEAGDLKPIRRWVRHEIDLPKRQTAMDGYWKRGTSDHDHHIAEDDGDS